MGDPSHVVGQPFDAGNSTRDGVRNFLHFGQCFDINIGMQIFPRMDFSACSDYDDVWQAYCDADDVYCDSGTSHSIHQGYVGEYGDTAADFVVSLIVQ